MRNVWCTGFVHFPHDEVLDVGKWVGLVHVWEVFVAVGVGADIVRRVRGGRRDVDFQRVALASRC